ncbi:propionate catabolism operon regulatory protein PrpR [Ramlibacter tataouinensis]|uniref:Candidate transcriptional regulator PrpR (Propionate catabolism operon regulatory protein), Fis family n=1 Tax=Ramlibacter tataouinensis (strain ATCC BAA-407 / DSM 14655 / LMG 21543 / TTB310) TaxID=365046 RepID=F5Y308_RAMTT|nr:propionate catabolism operon regulatory protein PrpR [Ramlibacter tataouinensis]AEG94888.1 Candidate transcriptional regulator PrpR (Propionate catabolism operon regulatory protein), Fis family [Ramlibacter tataouinensis TTB310]
MDTLHHPPARRPRLCFLSYRQIRAFAMPIVAEYAGRADIEVVDGSFDAALGLAQERIDKGLVDVFVSAGSNASLLRAGLNVPVATIKLGGFDLLQALIRAREVSPRVGIVTYGQTIPELDAVKALLNVDIRQYAYTTPEVARRCVAALRADGVAVVVGSSVVVELAQNAGLHGLLAYSLASVRQGFEDALELARVARLEAGRYEQLSSVVHHLRQAVLAVNTEARVIAANPAMQAILGLQPLVGRPLAELPPELALQPTLATGQGEHDTVLRLAGRDWLARRTPILEQGLVAGAALTLDDPRQIHEADNLLRIQRRRQQATTRYSFGSLLGQAPAFLAAVQTARRYARSGQGILITGESGVGKELFAQAIHDAGPQAKRPFVAVNCAAFPESLLESELFGHEEGAFTGARRGGRRGLFEAAHTGTLFLDEIGDMPLALQSRLLRVLQEREVTRLGGTAAIPVDVCVIAATHRDLAALVAEGRFRQDLYYRINTLPLALPALRERRQDILPLAEALLRRGLGRLGSTVEPRQVLAPLRGALESHPWPGNIRELENAMERLAVHLLQWSSAGAIDAARLRADFAALLDGVPVPAAGTPPGPLSGTRSARARQALARSSGRHGEAARALGVSRSTLWRWLREGGDAPA